jgi:hypothetical protein
METTYKVAGIDVHKRMLAVVITDATAEGEFRFERRKFGTLASDLQELAEWLAAEQVREAVMESTAQYWKPVWRQLEGQCRLELAQAQSNRARRGRKGDFRDAERLVRRHVAGELILSFVPNQEQRLWRTLTRSKQQLRRDRVRLQSQLEALLEDCRIKLASCVSDLLGVSSWRMLGGLAEGETDPQVLGSAGGAGTAGHAEAVGGRPGCSGDHGQRTAPSSTTVYGAGETNRPTHSEAARGHCPVLALPSRSGGASGAGARIWHRLGATGDCGGGAEGGHLR